MRAGTLRRTGLTRALSAPPALYWRLPQPRWAWALVAAAGLVVNVVSVFQQWRHLIGPLAGADYFSTFLPVIESANPYDVGTYLWSPLAVPLLGLVVPLGWPIWLAFHFAAVALLRPWWLAAIVLFSWPFWWDLGTSNVGIFLFVAAWWALRGNRAATLILMTMVVLMPRPIMLPLTCWLLWQRPWTRLPFAAIFLAHLALVLGSGFALDWWQRLTEVPGSEIAHRLNLGPSRVLGSSWVPIGIALGAWLTWKGRIGLASLAFSPYLFPYYLLFGLLELQTRRGADSMPDSPPLTRAPSAAAARAATVPIQPATINSVLPRRGIGSVGQVAGAVKRETERIGRSPTVERG